MKRTCAIIVPILIVFTLILPALSGNAAAKPDDWGQVAGGGVDGNYHAYYHIAQGIVTNGSNLYVGLNGAPAGWGPSVWQYDGATWTIIGDNGIDDADAEAVFTMASFRSNLYVGTLNGDVGCKVLRYDGGTSWTQVNDNGFGDEDNVSVLSMFVYNDALYAGTGHDYDGEVWRYNGSTWTRVGWAGPGMWDDGNWTIDSMCEYDDMLYVGTGNDYGAEVWRYSGTTWTQVADGGFGDPQNGDVMSMAALGDDLYAGTDHYGGCEVWSYDGSSWDQVDAIDPGFGDPHNTEAYSMTVFGGQLVIGTYGHCEIWQYDPVADDVQIMAERSFDEKDDPQGPGVDQGIQVSGFVMYGPNLYCCSAGIACAEVRRYQSGTTWPLISPLAFSTNQNIGVASMAMYNEQLCAGTDGQYTFGQVWRKSAQGNDWTRINEPGFGSNVVNGIDSVCSYQQGLYAGALNDDDGCEVWRYNGSNWLQVNEDGFGDRENIQALCMCVFNDRLYVGTFGGHGGQVWSYDGSTWAQANEDGFGAEDNGSVEGMAEFNGKLYAVTEEDEAPGGEGARVYRYDGGTTWTQVNEDGFGEANVEALSIAVMGGDMYVGTENKSGCQVWQYDGSSWTQVGDEGLGEPEFTSADSMAALGSRLYVGAGGPGGFRLMSYDGNSWTEAATPGFGDDYNDTALSMVADQSNLYVGTMNEYTGGEIWKTSVGPPVIDSLAPERGPVGTTVTVRGQGFGTERGSSYVSFGDARATEYGGWTDGEVECKVPAGVSGNCKVTLTTDSGTSNEKEFNVMTSIWYLAEGSTAWGFDAYVTVENPNSEGVDVKFTYLTNSGPVPGGTFTMAPRSQLTVNPSDVVGQADFSTKVECTQGESIAVDRTMFWSTEAHSSIGVTSPASTWYLPEGCSAYGFETWLLIENPNSTAATCNVTYMIEGAGPKTVVKTVPAGTRQSYNMESDIGQQNASIQVSSDIPVIPERSVYRYNREEGADSIGALAPATDFYLAEGTTAWGFETWLLVQNPNAADTEVSVTYMTPAGPVSQAPFNVPAQSRKTVKVNDVPGVANTDCSIKVHGRDPILAERAMYWNNGAKWAGHDSIGISAPHRTFYLPDGQSSEGRETWTLVQNPNDTAVTVTVAYRTSTGQGNVAFDDTIPANSRRTYNMSQWIKNGRASIEVTCPDRPVMVERSMYWNDRGAGTDTIGGFSD